MFSIFKIFFKDPKGPQEICLKVSKSSKKIFEKYA
jgi:hypothetical protein